MPLAQLCCSCSQLEKWDSRMTHAPVAVAVAVVVLWFLYGQVKWQHFSSQSAAQIFANVPLQLVHNAGPTRPSHMPAPSSAALATPLAPFPFRLTLIKCSALNKFLRRSQKLKSTQICYLRFVPAGSPLLDRPPSPCHMCTSVRVCEY